MPTQRSSTTDGKRSGPSFTREGWLSSCLGLIEREHKQRSATAINSPNHVKRLAASVLERAGVDVARIEKTA